MAVTPALSAITVHPSSVQSQVGIPGRITGLIITDFSPSNTANEELIYDEGSNPAVAIYSQQSFSIDINARVLNRTADIANAHVGAKFDIASIPIFVSGTSRGFPLVTSGSYEAGYFVFAARNTNTVSPTTLDSFGGTLRYWGYKLPVLPS